MSARSLRIEAELSPEALAVVRHAAELEGRSISDFVSAAASEVAYRIVEKRQIIEMSVADQQAFAAALIDPPAPSGALLRAADALRSLVKAPE